MHYWLFGGAGTLHIWYMGMAKRKPLLAYLAPPFSMSRNYKPSTTPLYSTLRTFSSRVLVTLLQHRLMPVVSRELISRDIFERWHSYRLRNIVQNPVIIVEQTTARHLKPFWSRWSQAL